MRNQHRLGALQVRVGGHGGGAGSFGAINKRGNQLGQLIADFVTGGARVQTQIGCDLLIAAAPAVQFVAQIADNRHQTLLDEVVDVFGFVVLEQASVFRNAIADLLQAAQHGLKFLERQDSGLRQRTRVGGTRLQLAFEQAAVEFPRPLPALKCWIKRLPEAARPHLHRVTSSAFVGAIAFCFFMASDREGSPRMRINPAASFWS